LVQIPAEIPDILKEVFRGFPESVQANVVIVPQLGQNRLFPNFPAVYYSATVLPLAYKDLLEILKFIM
jgi:hypothetical protein